VHATIEFTMYTTRVEVHLTKLYNGISRLFHIRLHIGYTHY